MMNKSVGLSTAKIQRKESEVLRALASRYILMQIARAFATRKTTFTISSIRAWWIHNLITVQQPRVLHDFAMHILYEGNDG